MNMRVWLLFLTLLSNFVFANCAEHVEISEAYIRAPIPGQTNTAGFMTFTNHSVQDCALLGVSSDIAKLNELHTHSVNNGVMHMHEVNQVDIPAMNQVRFQSGGLHVMLMGLKPNIAEHATLTFLFADGSSKTEELLVTSMLSVHQH